MTELGKEYFGPLWKYVADEKITDVDYNGREIWLTNTENMRYRANPEYIKEFITDNFIEQFTQRIANVVSRQFNKQNPQLEAETSELRVTIVHFCGMPGIGKTECIKFFSQYIPQNDRVITIEDTMEIRYSATNPGKDCVEMRVQAGRFDYADAIKSSLRLNPRWIMLSEARSKEVKYLLESWSTGVCGMTTLHTDDVRNIPDRILNMLENRVDADRLENTCYQAMDVGVLIRKRMNEQQQVYRYIDQVCFFLREGCENKIVMIVEDGKLVLEQLPEVLQAQFAKDAIIDPFSYEKSDCRKEAGDD